MPLDLANTLGDDIRALWLSLPLPPWSREKQRDREICAAPSAAFQKDVLGIGPDHLEFDVWRPQAHPKTLSSSKNISAARTAMPVPFGHRLSFV
jgi:hypothetical protein